MQKRTKLPLTHAYFGKLWSIGLVLMVVISEAFLQRLEDRSLQEVRATNLAPLTDKRYADNSHERFETEHQSHSFLNI